MGDQQSAIERFQTYLRIKTVHPEPDYAAAVSFLVAQARDLDLKCEQCEPVPGHPVVIMTWPGIEPTLPALLLNSHMDVVPVFPEYWRCDPFSAERTAEGDIYARGTQDMKSVTIQYLEAIRILRARGYRPRRTIYLTFVPDEEIGGVTGMKEFVKTPEFRALNIGCALDEGIANPGNEMTVFYGERHCWKVRVTCAGRTGHGSQFLPDTAGEKLRRVLDLFYNYRDEQEKLLAERPELKLGGVTTVNLTLIKGGVQQNVVPDQFVATFDVRVAQSTNPDDFEQLVKGWCEQAGSGVTYTTPQRECNPKLSCTEPTDPWWAALTGALSKCGVKANPEIFPAGTDSRFLRRLDIPCYGFSPMNHTPVLLHDHNEFLNEKVFLAGIDIYVELIPSLADVAA